MSHEQARREEDEPVKYGDLFNVEGDLAHKTVAPVDATLMRAAEKALLGETPKDGAAAAMQSAAARNERLGFVSRNEVTEAAGDSGISITQTDVDGRRVISERVGGQVLLLFHSFIVCLSVYILCIISCYI